MSKPKKLPTAEERDREIERQRAAHDLAKARAEAEGLPPPPEPQIEQVELEVEAEEPPDPEVGKQLTLEQLEQIKPPSREKRRRIDKGKLAKQRAPYPRQDGRNTVKVGVNLDRSAQLKLDLFFAVLGKRERPQWIQRVLLQAVHRTVRKWIRQGALPGDDIAAALKALVEAAPDPEHEPDPTDATSG